MIETTRLSTKELKALDKKAKAECKWAIEVRMEGPDGKPLVKRIASEEPENAAKSAMHIELAEKELLRDWGFLFAKME